MSINTNTANTTKPATRPAGFTKREWDEKTVRAFKGLTMVVDGTLPHGNTSILKAYLRHPVVAELFSQCGIPADEQHVLMLLFAMVRERREERHIVTVSSLRKWFNGGWKVAEGKPVTFTAPKEPAPAKKAIKAKNTLKNAGKVVSKLTDAEQLLLAQRILKAQGLAA